MNNLNKQFLQEAVNTINQHVKSVENSGARIIWPAGIIKENNKLTKNPNFYNVKIRNQRFNLFDIYTKVRRTLSEHDDKELIDILDN